MKSFFIAGAAALGLMFTAAPTTAEAGCYRGGGYGYAPVYGYGGGFGGGYGYHSGYSHRSLNYGYAPVRRNSFYAPVSRRGFSPYGYNNFNRRGSNVIISTPRFGIRF